MAGDLRSRRATGALAIVAVAAAIAGVAGAADTDPCAADAPSYGRCGDGGAAVKARLNRPLGVAYTHDGRLLIADTGNEVIRQVDPGGVITTIAGTGETGEDGDGGPPTAAHLTEPRCILEQDDGSILIQDDSAIRMIKDGMISTVAGPDPCPHPRLPDGDYLTPYQNVVLRTTPAGDTTLAAGTNECGSSGDGGSATKAQLNSPHGVAGMPDGGFLIADTRNNEIRRVSPHGVITAIAGDATTAPCLKQGASQAYVVHNDFVNLPAAVHAKSGKSIVVSYSSSFDGVAYFTLTRSGKIVFKGQKAVASGINHFRLPAIKKKGRYKLNLKAIGTASSGSQLGAFNEKDSAAFTVK